VLVAGYIFKADNPTQTIADLKIDNDINKKARPDLFTGGYFYFSPFNISERLFAIAIVNAKKQIRMK
jgi:hypothetical protein